MYAPVPQQLRDGPRVVHVRTDDEGAAAWPAWGVLSSSVRQRRTTCPRDLPYGEQSLVVRWHKVQFACRESDCARTAFTEQIAEVPLVRESPHGCAGMSPRASGTAWP